MSLNTFCSHCGTKFAEQKKYPRKCFYCGNDTYRNPIPVVVAVLPIVKSTMEFGILKLRRGNEPGRGEWALPGGFLEYGETWQEGLVREVQEELNLGLQPEGFVLQGVENSSSGNLILFAMYPTLTDLPIAFEPNDEVTEIGLFTNLEEKLAFPTHTTHAKRGLQVLRSVEFGVYI